MPIFAESINTVLPIKARPAINRAMVKPTPESMAIPTISIKRVFLGSEANLNFILKYENSVTPMVFPRKRESAIFTAKGMSMVISLAKPTPELDKANTGIIKKATQ